MAESALLRNPATPGATQNRIKTFRENVRKLENEQHRARLQLWALWFAPLPKDQSAAQLDELEKSVNWVRWHDLLELKDKGTLQPQEQDEYRSILKVVELLDKRETRRSLGTQIKTTQEFLNSIDRATEMVLELASKLGNPGSANGS
jgi:hypothetical protein